ncbi:MAG: tRNA epoxyqueuosine(34) reductase QueG [Planctomycetia bacterium]|nr:tRNA epoxyqueuosine(34) reductase QueG [Planctomycetia bacterium]
MPTIYTEQLTDQLKAEAMRLGFTLAGVCPAVTPQGLSHLDQWLSAGYAGEMHYLADRRAAYEHPRHVLDGVRSVLMLTLNYRTIEPTAPTAGHGRISRYACGADYHDVIHERLAALSDWLRLQRPEAMVRGVVDTAPLMEREFAQLAGLGWIGKNTLLLNRTMGSWFFLAALLTDIELHYDAPHETDHCGTCTACLDACPTDAFVAPYVLDSRRCISYLTIELKGPVPHELRPGLDDWLFGCDICQEVCPWNHRAPLSNDAAFEPHSGAGAIELAGLFELDGEAFRSRFRNTPLWRPKRRGILRNAAIALGNHPDSAVLPALVRGLHDSEPLIRGASAWALGRFAANQIAGASTALRERKNVESDAEVLNEINSALTADFD